MVKRILKKALKVVTTMTVGYVVIVAILTAISPKLVKREEEDEDFDDFYDDPKHCQDLKEFGDLYNEYENERNFGCECSDYIN